jgi:molybdopterin-containing oxidoreductase family iron-sulfur binding subunit
MNRLYAVETMPTPTGARADHRLPVKPSDVEGVAREILTRIGSGGSRGSAGARGVSRATFIDAVAKDLLAHRGRSLVVAGEHQPPVVHALAHAMNGALGNAGATVVYTQPVEAEPINQLDSLRALADDMRAGQVELLVIVSGNPVYTAPIDLDFAGALGTVALRVHLAMHNDETSALCQWHVPEAHFLETWSDARACDGTASIIQPLITPLYGGKSAHELIAAMSDRPERSAYDIVREYWKVGADDSAWRRWLHDGVIPDTAFAAKAVRLTADATTAPSVASGANAASGFSRTSAPAAASGLEIAFRNDPCVLDGRFANNGWLQELPKPITKLTWDNAVLASPATVERLKAAASPAFQGGEHGQIVSDVVWVQLRGRRVQGVLFPVIGHADGCVTVHLGYGRSRAGRVGSGTGFNANALRTADALSSAGGCEITLTGDRGSLACTQYHHMMEGRHMVRAVTRDEYVHDPKSVHEGDETPARTITLYPEFPYTGYKWGMAIDINACIGCNACVGRLPGREQHPGHRQGSGAARPRDALAAGRHLLSRRRRQPRNLLSSRCRACTARTRRAKWSARRRTVHSDEGLNDMVYNRCVGTRYCSNNCPYKVRRFNYLLYQDWNTPT